jgi:cytochrome c biogenesis protein CcmG/thiol:disulfide interchange protein DsbE
MRILRWALVPALVVPVGWVLFQGLGRDPRALPSPLIGRPAPAFELLSLDGRTIDSATLRGRVVLVNFWASWCFECIAEHRVLLEAQAQYGPDLVIIGVLYQDTVDDARRFLARYGDGGWPNLIDADGALAIDYGVTGVPESFFIGRDGIVRYKQYGAVTQAVLDAQLPSLVADANASSHERSVDAIPFP